MIALDTNLLVYAHRELYPEHAGAKRAIEKACGAPGGWGIAAFCISEFWAVVTHPAAEKPSRPEQARAFLFALTAAGARIFAPRDGFHERLIEVATVLRVQGPRIFDLQIGLASFESGATELWTHDRHFVSVPGLQVRDPL